MLVWFGCSEVKVEPLLSRLFVLSCGLTIEAEIVLFLLVVKAEVKILHYGCLEVEVNRFYC